MKAQYVWQIKESLTTYAAPSLAGRSVVASTKLMPDEQEELDRRAKSAGKAFSEWAREVLLSAASRRRTFAVITVLRPVA